MPPKWKLLSLSIALALLPLCASAQVRAGIAVGGVVKDSTGSAVADAPVELDTTGGVAIAQGKTDKNGSFALSAIPPGDYLFVAKATNGFAAQTLPLKVDAALMPLRVTLVPEAVTQSIDVSGEQQLSNDAASNKDTISVGGKELEKLPVFDQDYIAALMPFLDDGSSGSGGVSLIVDGVEMKRAGVSASAIQEVKVNNDPYTAESNRPGRGRIEIMTKPGSPEFHGEFNFLVRDAALNAKNYFAAVKPPEQRRIYEGSFTGPAGKGKRTTFLLTESRREDDLAVVVTGLGASTNVNAPVTNTEITGRVSHDFSATHRAALQYNFSYQTTRNEGVGGIVLAEAGIDHDEREDDLVFNDRLIFSPTLLNQLQITLEKDEEELRSVTNAPSIQVSDLLTRGGAQMDLSRGENTIKINEIVSWTHGRHYLRFGPQIPQISRRALDERSNRLGTFLFNSLTDLNAGKPASFTAQQGPGRGIFWFNELGTFVEDQIKVNPKLQVSLGLRYDWQTYISDTTTFAPRVSAAYSLGKTGTTVLRTGVGIFYDRIYGDLPGQFKVHNGVELHAVQISNPAFPVAIPPGETIANLPTTLVQTEAAIRKPYTIQYSLATEHQLSKKITVTAGYRGFVGVHTFRSRDANAPLPPDYTSVPDPAFGFIQQIESRGHSMQNAMDLGFHGEAGRWFKGRAQYTLSRTSSNTGGIESYPQDQYKPNDEWGRSDMDRLQKFNLIGNINPDHWVTLGVSATLYSGTPYTELAGGTSVSAGCNSAGSCLDPFGTGLGNARPVGVGRNTLTAGGRADLDLLWDHDFHLDKSKGDEGKIFNVGASAFDVLNRTNFTNYVGNISSPDRFERPTAALPGRQFQFSVQYSF